jgi:DNA-binding MarR family transcriptional regulator
MTIIKHFSKVKRDFVNKWLRNQKTLAVHISPRLNLKKNSIVSKMIDHLWQADLIEISISPSNNNIRYILMVIDNLSKYGWSVCCGAWLRFDSHLGHN